MRNFLREKEVDRVAVQLPSGLRPFVREIVRVYDEVDVEALFTAGSCYGSCDLADGEAEELGCDALIHYGHADMGIPTALPTLYVEARVEVEPFEALDRALPELEGSSWGLTATVQHVGFLEEVRKFLGERGIEAVIGDPGSRCGYPGQILGCDWGSARSVAGEVDGILYIGTGRFHPIGLALATRSRVVSVDPVSGGHEVVDPGREKFLRRRYAAVARAESGESFGVIVSTKAGQNRMNLAERLAGELEDSGYEADVLVTDEVGPELLENYQLDAYVNTACPRISIDDSELYDRPVLTPFEAEVLTGEGEWDEYRLDEIGRNWEG
ncbi:hypothetical protein AKJ57_00160 [candidate division MSBL1 archaeon SCGC-AAA259A05]|uniref:2-(3-amino-3-carboxypropyl)histidine synthase n=1 Tax=candidate division MSBL1 archaeon SCGC-AAA259A05 TaxID=1698259 RepID=A0A133UC29_9EURY|nr:hypothetical protein AKJ57_00160 [candidate division MSBL1 archaeon SCGC-AAA259A05]